MDLKQLFDADDRGVSPVIGVILMVAITVILAAVIATFVMNMGPPEDQAPQASWSIEYEDNNVTVSHDGGDAAQANELVVQVEDDKGNSASFDFTEAPDWDDETEISASSPSLSINNSAPAATSAWVDNSSGDGTVWINNVTSVELLWESSDADKSQSLKKWDN